MINNNNHFNFKGCINMSRGTSTNASIDEILIANIPNAFNVLPSSKYEDKNGTDKWVCRQYLPKLSIDVKVRTLDPTKDLNPPSDDLALETYSDIKRQTPGWTRNPNKRTDYVMWYFKTTCRWVLIPFPMLCAVFLRRWQGWRNQYKPQIQTTDNDGVTWQSECLYIPRQIVWNEICGDFGGIPLKVNSFTTETVKLVTKNDWDSVFAGAK